MDGHRYRRGGGRDRGPRPGPEFTLSYDSAREVVGSTGPPRSRESFLSTDHLSIEAAAAYVDGQLPAAGQARADAHLARCELCRQEVDDQREARRVLRGSGPIQMPRELLERLRSLEGTPDPAGPPPRVFPAGIDGHVDRRIDWARLLRRVWRRGH